MCEGENWGFFFQERDFIKVLLETETNFFELS